jgi:hypothetical protein
MPQADQPRKQRYHWLLAPFVLVGIAAIGWSIWWVHGRGVLQAALDNQASSLKSRGAALSWTSRAITGFPFRYDVTLNGFTAAEPNGLAVATDKLELEAMAYDPTHWVGETSGPVHITEPGHDLTVTGDVMRFSVSHLKEAVPRISLEGQRLKLVGWGPFSAIDRFEVHLLAKDADTASFFLRIDKATAEGTSLLARMAPAQGVIVGLEGDLTKPAALHGAGLRGALVNWSAAGGAFNIRQGGLQAGDALLSLGPTTLYPSADGTVNGELALQLTKASDAVLAMGAVGVLPKETAAVGSGIASVGQLFNGGKAKPLKVTLKFSNGLTTLQGVPIGPAPKLFKP